MHVFACTQTLATVQAEIFQVSQLLCVLFPPTPNVFFPFGQNQASKVQLHYQVTCKTAHGPPLHCFLQPTASRSGEKWQEWSSLVEQEHRHTLLICPTSCYFSSHLFFFFPLLVKKKKIHLGNKAFLKDRKAHAC